MTPEVRARLRRTEMILSDTLRSPVARAIGIGGTAVALLGFAGFQVFAIRSLAALGLARAPQIWSHAQLLKYLPVPASAMAGFIGSAVQQGHRARQALGGLVLHTLVLVLGATVVAAGVLVSHAEGLGPATVTMILMAGVGPVGGVAALMVHRHAIPPRAFCSRYWRGCPWGAESASDWARTLPSGWTSALPTPLPGSSDSLRSLSQPASASGRPSSWSCSPRCSGNHRRWSRPS